MFHYIYNSQNQSFTMKLLKLLTVLLFTCASFSASAQYDEVQLPNPDDVSPFFFGSINSSKIYYGASPATDADKPVLVFVHGFTDLANSWFIPGNNLYDSAYKDGYRTAFVAMTRGEGMWANGDLLADMLEDIVVHYGVNDVVIVAHSNGGKASEVAMFYHDKKDLVERAITLGTPFFGTEVADLAETFAFRWLVNFVGLGGGTSTSTTYYMGGVARPYLDNLSNNEPGKFINLGARGKCSGSTITAPVMCVAGGYISLAGGGPNDGVTPYYSSTRPGGFPYWTGSNIPYYDHIDITQDFIMWNDVEPLIGANLNNLQTAPKKSIDLFPKQEVVSNFQILSSENEQTSFVVEEGASDIQIELFYTKDNASFELLTADNKPITTNTNFIKSEKYNGQSATLMVEDLEAGHYNLQSTDEQYLAIVSYDGGVSLRHNSELSETKPAYTSDETVRFNMEVLDMDLPELVEMTAVVALKNDLKGNPINGKPVELDFERQADGSYVFKLNQPDEGVYNVLVEAKGETFVRNLITGFVVNAANKTVATQEIGTEFNVNPTLVETMTTVTVEISEDTDNVLSLYDVQGRLVKKIDLDGHQSGIQQIDLNLEGLQSGVYLLNFYSNKGIQTQRVVKK